MYRSERSGAAFLLLNWEKSVLSTNSSLEFAAISQGIGEGKKVDDTTGE